MADQLVQQNVSQTTIPDYARPYVEEMLGQARALTDLSQNPYMQYEGQRFAQFTPLQQQSFENAAMMVPQSQIGDATAMAGLAGLGALSTRYGYTPYTSQYQAPDAYQSATFTPRDVSAASLQQYQMGPAERVRTSSFARPGAAEAYMSPYMQNVVDVQQREARRQAAISGQAQQAQAARAGAFGGARDIIQRSEANRALQTQLAGIQATGLQSAYQQAQQQFNAEQQARLAAQQANQQAGLTVGGQNLAALLGVQQLGSQQNLQAQLANQQAQQAAQQAAEQSRQYGYGQSMAAAGNLAQYGQAAAQLGEQSRQFGAGLGLQGLQTALTASGQLGQLGQQQFAQEMDINKLQNLYGGQQQQQMQNILGAQYQDYLNYQNYPYKQIGFMSDLLRGLPLTQTSTAMYGQAPSTTSQLVGLGTAALGASRLGLKKGGAVKAKKGGLSELAFMKITEGAA